MLPILLMLTMKSYSLLQAVDFLVVLMRQDTEESRPILSILHHDSREAQDLTPIRSTEIPPIRDRDANCWNTTKRNATLHGHVTVFPNIWRAQVRLSCFRWRFHVRAKLAAKYAIR
jgi:hypothetical protein